MDSSHAEAQQAPLGAQSKGAGSDGVDSVKEKSVGADFVAEKSVGADPVGEKSVRADSGELEETMPIGTESNGMKSIIKPASKASNGSYFKNPFFSSQSLTEN